MSKPKSAVVVGGGFGGIAAAYLLAKRGCEVTMVSRAHLGGVAGGVAWGAHSLDRGCHIFGNNDDRITEILQALLGGEFHSAELSLASRFGGKTLEGFELPDLSTRADSGQMILELCQRELKSQPAPRTLDQLLVQRFGETASAALDEAFQKKFRISSAKVAPEAIYATCFKRIRVVNDTAGRVLKQAPELDSVIAVGCEDDPMKYYRDQVSAPYRAYYPARDGMAGFIRSAQRVLESLGVKFVLGESVTKVELGERAVLHTSSRRLEADHCLWTVGHESLETMLLGTNSLAGTCHYVPMALYYFELRGDQAGPYSYINSFDSDDRIFRACLPSNYGRGTNCSPGRAYLCCEVPVDLHSEQFQDPDYFVAEIWQEACDFGVVRGRRGRHRVLVTPASYRIPLAHYGEMSRPIHSRCSEIECLTVSDPWAFTKNRITADLDERIGALWT